MHVLYYLVMFCNYKKRRHSEPVAECYFRFLVFMKIFYVMVHANDYEKFSNDVNTKYSCPIKDTDSFYKLITSKYIM